jgi:hypothetical protein
MVARPPPSKALQVPRLTPEDAPATVDLNTERYRRERDDARRERDQRDRHIIQLQGKCDLLTSIDGVGSAPPRWLSPPKAKAGTGIVNLMLSDLHFDEVISSAQMNGVNAYNRQIAAFRLQRTFDKFIQQWRDYVTGIKYEGCAVWLGGDLFSGNIHEELRITNEMPVMASLDFWIDPMIAGLRLLADEFGRVHVPSVVGNHGRNTYKPIMKNRVEDNFDWLFTRVLHRELRGDKRLTWDIPLTADVIVQQYDTRILMTHGDQARGGSGISGIQTPLALLNFRKSKNYGAMDLPYDHMVMGHFHQYLTLPGVTVNGSLKGFDEYALISNFGFEIPQQATWVTTPERGITWQVALQPSDRKREKW